MVVVYNVMLSSILFFLLPFILQKYKFDKIKGCYDFWVHCASLGEVKIALRFINTMISKLNISRDKFLLTTTTITAKNFAKKFHNNTYILPLDYWLVTRKYVKIVKPKVLIILETELWPNLIHFVKHFGGKIFVINGRMTKKTFVFLKTFRFLFWPMIKNIDYILVREKFDYMRFIGLGFSKQKVKITGNMKYDEVVDISDFVLPSKATLGLKEDEIVVTFGSIREKEERYIIQKVVRKFVNDTNVKFILIPRHLRIIPSIISTLQKYSIPYVFKSKQINLPQDNYKCIVVDTYGEVLKIYSISDIIFVCGTILPYGGQNVIEAAIFGKLVVFGKYIKNFYEPASLLLSENAALQVTDLQEFVKIIYEFINNKQKFEEYGKKAKKLVYQMQGSTLKNVEEIRKLIS